MGRKPKQESGSPEPSLKLVTKEQIPEAEWITFECPKGRKEAMPAEVNPLCSGLCCNFRRKMKPRKTCEKCQGTGRKATGSSLKCSNCWGNGKVSPDFTPEERE